MEVMDIVVESGRGKSHRWSFPTPTPVIICTCAHQVLPPPLRTRVIFSKEGRGRGLLVSVMSGKMPGSQSSHCGTVR